MAQNSYSKIELGDNALTDKNIFLICLIYSVNEMAAYRQGGDV
jgi:hypothetical protein